MSLAVEVAGFGICHTQPPYPVLIICVQQESFQAWTVYRLYESFAALSDQLRQVYPATPDIPAWNSEDLSLGNLEWCRAAMNEWLMHITSNAFIFRTQSMYHFLCDEANQPPPFLELHWRNSESFDEMEMDEMFDKHLDEENDDDCDVDDEEDPSSPGHQDGGVFVFAKKDKVKKRPSIRVPPAAPAVTESSRDDGLDIQSLSYVQGEFLYDREEDTEEGSSSASSMVMTPSGMITDPSAAHSAAPKRIVSLESFNIIKVIGKGLFLEIFIFTHFFLLFDLFLFSFFFLRLKSNFYPIF